MKRHPHTGSYIAFVVMACWLACLLFSFSLSINGLVWWIFPLIILQSHLYTGVFITAHDAMHGTVSANRKLNNFVGICCATLFAFNSWNTLYAKHHAHHRHVATELDPDFHHGNFVVWYFSFLKNYLSMRQLLLMALTFNVLILLVAKVNVILFWVVPALLSTLQLFYFGTWLPHHGTFDSGNRHHASSLRKNHFMAFISCYFFGYHYEHHDSPQTPWWQLPALKDVK